jgi:hypothetical protein
MTVLPEEGNPVMRTVFFEFLLAPNEKLTIEVIKIARMDHTCQNNIVSPSVVELSFA